MIIRRFCLRVGAIALAAAALQACESTPKVRTSTDPSANLSSYKTYTFAPQPGTNRGGVSTPLTGYFEAAIAREMDSRGYVRDDKNAELVVNFNANSKDQADIRSTPGPTYYGGYYGYRGGLYAGGPDIQTVHYKVGTANVDIVDWAKKKMLWGGVAEGELTDSMMKNPQAAVDGVVKQMFMQFPGRAAP